MPIDKGNIDFSKVVDASTLAFRGSEAAVLTAKAECSARISEILDQHTFSNLLAAAVLGELTEAERDILRDGQKWIRKMLDHCRKEATSGMSDWPEPPDGLAALAEKY